MGLSHLKCWVFVSVCCLSRVYSYNVQRIENENSQPVNLEIDFFSTYESRYLDNLDHLEKAESEEDKRFANNFRTMSTKPPVNNDSTPLDSWSVVWYIASFGGLIIFFLIVSCSEWCCRRALRNNQSCNNNTTTPSNLTVPDTPPPSYDQFAPPSYESICLGRNGRGSEKSEYDIYVVPVHALGTIMQTRDSEDAPPSYLSASTPTFVPAYPLRGPDSNQESRVT